MPSIEAMLITLAGRSALAAARSGRAAPGSGRTATSGSGRPPCPSRFSGNVVEGRAPGRAGVVDQDVELVLARGDRRRPAPRTPLDRRDVRRQRDARPGGRRAPRRSRRRPRPCATRCRPCAPCARKPAAIMRPMPREPPVTSAVRPAREKRSFMGRSPVGRAFAPQASARPCRQSSAATMRPAAISRAAARRPLASACATSASGSGGTAQVTRRSPRSLSSRTALAGRRTMRGSSTSTALATTVAAASAREALVASTVTASAMPSEKLRPRQPEVAMPRTGDAGVDPRSGRRAAGRRGRAPGR